MAPLVPLTGRWRTSGTVLDERGGAVAEIAGTDVYALLPGGHWIAHDVDVRIGGERTLVHELIGGAHSDGGWRMHAFDTAGSPGLMRLGEEGPGVLLVHGDGVRSRLVVRGDRMTAHWDREVDGRWQPWMDMAFERL